MAGASCRCLQCVALTHDCAAALLQPYGEDTSTPPTSSAQSQPPRTTGEWMTACHLVGSTAAFCHLLAACPSRAALSTACILTPASRILTVCPRSVYSKLIAHGAVHAGFAGYTACAVGQVGIHADGVPGG